MKAVVHQLFVTGAAVVAFGLAPQVFAQQSREGINPQLVPGNANCDDEQTVVEVCGFAPLGRPFLVDPAKDAMWQDGDTHVTFVVSSRKRKRMGHGEEPLADRERQPLSYRERPPKSLEFTEESVSSQFFGGLGAVFVYAGRSANLYCYDGSGITMDSDLGAPGLEGISGYEACAAPGSCRLDPDDLDEICELASSEIIKLENIDNTPISTCGCPNPDPDDPDLEITIEQCSDAVCSNLEGPQILAPDASRVSYGDGLVGSRCRKETTCEVPPLGGDLVCKTKKICKKKKNRD